MSELNNRDRNAYSKFEHMSTEDLETILRLDYQLPEGEGLDPDTILAITEVIANREESDSAPQYPDTDTAWNDFLTKYRPHGGSFLDAEADTVSKQEQSKSNLGDSPAVQRRRSMRWLTRTALVAAIIAALLLATTVTASAFGYDLWNVIAEWSKETFTFTRLFPGIRLNIKEFSPKRRNSFISRPLSIILRGPDQIVPIFSVRGGNWCPTGQAPRGPRSISPARAE